MMNPITKLIPSGAMILLAGCGTTEPGRLQGPATAGAHVGVVVSRGGADTTTGAAITSKEGNLGEPAWDKK
jgi:hypothetical protein